MVSTLIWIRKVGMIGMSVTTDTTKNDDDHVLIVCLTFLP